MSTAMYKGQLRFSQSSDTVVDTRTQHNVLAEGLTWNVTQLKPKRVALQQCLNTATVRRVAYRHT